jgi:hypothetical protein
MPSIQVTTEISTQLGRLRSAINTSVAFNRAQQLTFEDNDGFIALEGYQEAIQTMGRLATGYQQSLEREIRNCERLVANMRTRDQALATAMFRG